MLVSPDEEPAGEDPEEVWPEIKAEIMAIRDASGYEQGSRMALEFIRGYRGRYPSLVRALEEDLEALLSHLKVPFRHRVHVRTTNLLERSFEERGGVRR